MSTAPRLTPEQARRGFARMLRATRDARGWTQEELAKRCRMKQSAVAHFEGGRRTPNILNLIKLADALGCSTDLLLMRPCRENGGAAHA